MTDPGDEREYAPEEELSKSEQGLGVVELSDADLAGLTSENNVGSGAGVENTPGYNALLRAISQIGTHETGTNCQPYSTYFNAGCVAWCAYFVAWCFDTSASGNRDKRVPWTSRGTGSSEAIYRWGAANGRVVAVPQSGDIFTYRDFHHSGIVRGVNTTTKAFNSVDGNWSDQVIQVARNYGSGSYYFIRVASSPV